jgi:hypothetical protein
MHGKSLDRISIPDKDKTSLFYSVLMALGPFLKDVEGSLHGDKATWRRRQCVSSNRWYQTARHRRTKLAQAEMLWFIFGKCSVWTSARDTSILIQLFVSFRQFLPEIIGIYFKLGHDHFHRHPFQLIRHYTVSVADIVSEYMRNTICIESHNTMISKFIAVVT